MRDINIGIEGVSPKVDSESFWVASEVPLQVVSSSVVGGDLKETSHILSVRVPADPEQRDYALRRPRAFVRDRAQALGINGPGCGLDHRLGPQSAPGGNLRRTGDKSGRRSTVGTGGIGNP